MDLADVAVSSVELVSCTIRQDSGSGAYERRILHHQADSSPNFIDGDTGKIINCRLLTKVSEGVAIRSSITPDQDVLVISAAFLERLYLRADRTLVSGYPDDVTVSRQTFHIHPSELNKTLCFGFTTPGLHQADTYQWTVLPHPAQTGEVPRQSFVISRGEKDDYLELPDDFNFVRIGKTLKSGLTTTVYLGRAVTAAEKDGQLHGTYAEHVVVKFVRHANRNISGWSAGYHAQSHPAELLPPVPLYYHHPVDGPLSSRHLRLIFQRLFPTENPLVEAEMPVRAHRIAAASSFAALHFAQERILRHLWVGLSCHHFMLVSTFVPARSLDLYVQNLSRMGHRLTDESIRRCTRQMLETTAFLHEHCPTALRDGTLSNILCTGPVLQYFDCAQAVLLPAAPRALLPVPSYPMCGKLSCLPPELNPSINPHLTDPNPAVRGYYCPEAVDMYHVGMNLMTMYIGYDNVEGIAEEQRLRSQAAASAYAADLAASTAAGTPAPPLPAVDNSAAMHEYLLRLYGDIYQNQLSQHMVGKKQHPQGPYVPQPLSALMPAGALELLQCLLSLDPTQRPSAAQALQHWWLQPVQQQL